MMNENVSAGNVFSKQDLNNLLASLQKLVLYNAVVQNPDDDDDEPTDQPMNRLNVSKSMQDLRMRKSDSQAKATPPSASTATTGTSSTSEFWPSSMDFGPPSNRLKDHHRFSRRNDPEFSMAEAEQRQKKSMQYKQQLEDQIVEKQSKQNLFRQNERKEEAIFEQKLQHQRTMMREEYEREHPVKKNDQSTTAKQVVQNNRKKDNRRNRSLSVYSLLHLVDQDGEDQEDSKSRNGKPNGDNNDHNKMLKHRNVKSDNEGDGVGGDDLDDDNDRHLRKALPQRQLPHHQANNAIFGVDVSTQTDLSLLLSWFDHICIEQQQQSQSQSQQLRHHQSRNDRFSATNRMQPQQPQLSSNRTRPTSRNYNSNNPKTTTTTIKKHQR